MKGASVLVAALAIFGSLLGASAQGVTLTVTDPDILNFALNLECLEAAFYSYAAFGTPLTPELLGGGGPITGGQKANLQGSALQYAIELANDEIAHVALLRNALGAAAVPCPAMDISSSFAGFIQAGLNALQNPNPYAPFDPYYSFLNFYFAAYILEDVGVTAYEGAGPLIANSSIAGTAAAILAVEAYHAGAIRENLATLGYFPTPYGINVTTATQVIAAVRATLSGADDDQGIAVPFTGASNLVPADENSLVYARTPQQVLSVVYGSGSPTKPGLFFPQGVNGAFSVDSLTSLTG